MFCGREDMNLKVPNLFSGFIKLGVTALLISCWNKDFSEARLLSL